MLKQQKIKDTNILNRKQFENRLHTLSIAKRQTYYNSKHVFTSKQKKKDTISEATLKKHKTSHSLYEYKFVI